MCDADNALKVSNLEKKRNKRTNVRAKESKQASKNGKNENEGMKRNQIRHWDIGFDKNHSPFSIHSAYFGLYRPER